MGSPERPRDRNNPAGLSDRNVGTSVPRGPSRKQKKPMEKPMGLPCIVVLIVLEWLLCAWNPQQPKVIDTHSVLSIELKGMPLCG